MGRATCFWWGAGYHLGVSAGALLVRRQSAWRVTKWMPVWQMNVLVLGFIVLAYPLGSCMDLYHLLPGYDKLVHMLSDVFVNVLCVIFHCVLRPQRQIGPDERAMALVCSWAHGRSRAVVNW